LKRNHKTYAFKGNKGKRRKVWMLSFMPGMLQVGVQGKSGPPYFSLKSNDMIGVAVAILRAQGLEAVGENEEFQLMQRDIRET
jgi:hypothetical protein